MQIQKKGIRMCSKLNNNVSPKLYIYTNARNYSEVKQQVLKISSKCNERFMTLYICGQNNQIMSKSVEATNYNVDNRKEINSPFY